MVAEGFEWVNTCKVGDHEVFNDFDGQARIPGWEPINVRRRGRQSAGV